jgi:hypothetical protein
LSTKTTFARSTPSVVISISTFILAVEIELQKFNHQWRAPMPFSPEERKALLGVKGVGPTMIVRLEQMGFESLAHLSKANALDIVSQASAIVGSTCWKNSPQARAAIQAAIALAQSRHG